MSTQFRVIAGLHVKAALQRPASRNITQIKSLARVVRHHRRVNRFGRGAGL